MFERFTDRARQVVVLAQEEARGLGHTYIGTEHILLGLLREEDGIDDQALAAAVGRARGAGAAPLHRDGYNDALLRARARLGLGDGDPPAPAG